MKTDFLIKKKNLNYLWLWIPMGTFFCLGLIGFILTSFWKLEWDSAILFAQGMEYKIVHYWVAAMLEIGETELLIIGSATFFILLESFFRYKIHKTQNGFYFKNRWILIAIYLLMVLSWLAYNIYSIIEMNWKNTGFGPGIDVLLFQPFKVRQTVKIVIFIFQTVILLSLYYWIHFKLAKKKSFVQDKYWIQALKIVSFFCLSYFVVAFLKISSSRPYLYNMQFETLAKENGYLEIYQNTNIPGFDKQGWKSIDGTWSGNAPEGLEIPWWDFNGFFGFNSDPNFPKLQQGLAYAFPSGHVNGTYCVGSFFWILCGRKNKINNSIKVLIVWFILHLTSMSFALVVCRGHWWSDITFSLFFGIIALVLVELSINQIFRRKTK
ncbi:hypothetical protein ESOMN_v1c03100 [Williamsoniiplasma somnilux]|uniref:Phosphatidic acid phosphatase type 2/haloperoxidase domain-containing protein n=1 Tax=Williamsoniiplasma somnilux TaxID=215578 RepID=A0A2K8NXY7_9MOLU|nr:phosphatase PAP2 family protein [Williamsoniiplasma somnilux]ATZ18692.1 hypothetical protein ESOMN_v1c03100 [Williamsoniiplasma somnilux]